MPARSRLREGLIFKDVMAGIRAAKHCSHVGMECCTRSKLSHDFAPAVTKLPSESMSLIGSGSAAASGDMMLLDAIALLILAGMMFIPLVNVIVGVVVGAGLAGPPGALCGLMSALAITAAQKMIRQRKAWFHFSPADGRDPF